MDLSASDEAASDGDSSDDAPSSEVMLSQRDLISSLPAEST